MPGLRRLLLPALLLPALAAPGLAASAAGAGAVGRAAAVSADAPTPAATPAVVRSVLRATSPTSLKGRLTSSRSACVSGRDVFGIFREDGQPYPVLMLLDTTDGQGRWRYPTMKRGPVPSRVVALTLGGPQCRIAQSNQVVFASGRSGAGRAAPAGVSISFGGSTLATSGGRITSGRAVCTKNRPIFAFFRQDGGNDPFSSGPVSVSRADGRYRFGEDGSMPRLGGTATLFTVVPGTNHCRPAQSPLVQFTG